MNAFFYGVSLQWKLDIRSKSLLITCYLVPLLFFAVMGGIFTSLNPQAKDTLIQSMTIMGVAMGAFIGLPPSIVEIYGSDMKKVYKANGVPIYFGVVTLFISAFTHLMIMSAIIFFTAPLAFGAAVPDNIWQYIASLAIFVAVSLCIGCVLGLAVKSQSRLTMFSQILFLPSIMLSGIMFAADLLPKPLEYAGMFFSASWGFKLMLNAGFEFANLWPLILMLTASIMLCVFLLNKTKAE